VVIPSKLRRRTGYKFCRQILSAGIEISAQNKPQFCSLSRLKPERCCDILVRPQAVEKWFDEHDQPIL
jgi:hypothetical protein